mmetsp:Transcript_5855/g.10749  ORF Transcript_5855/g.10749 Transcript_5855/m.10749 type:complete len:300 (-) Transcript_5855:239-1138(-)
MVELDLQLLQVANAADVVLLPPLSLHDPLQKLLGHLHVYSQLLHLLKALHVVLPPPPRLGPVGLVPRPENIVRIRVTRRSRSLQASQQGLVPLGPLLLPVLVDGSKNRVLGPRGSPQGIEGELPLQVAGGREDGVAQGAGGGAGRPRTERPLRCLRTSKLQLVEHELKLLLVQVHLTLQVICLLGLVILKQPVLVVVIQVIFDGVPGLVPHRPPYIRFPPVKVRPIVLLIRRVAVHHRNWNLRHFPLALLHRQDLLILRIQSLVTVSDPSRSEGISSIQVLQVPHKRQQAVYVHLPRPV